MFAVFIEVIKDLLDFAVIQHLPRKAVPAQLLLTANKKNQTSTQSSQSGVSSVLPSLESRVCFVNQTTLSCLQTPQKKYDTRRGVFSYGDSVRVTQQKNSWSFVESSALSGWVETKGLATDAAEVFPVFKNNSINAAADENTEKLRKYLHDALLGGQLGLDLQSTEYIHYRLKRSGVTPHWPLERPRLPGNWQQILKGKRGVVISLEPKTASIMECNACQEKDFLAYIESVTPDGVITFSCVGRTHDGVYEEMQYTKTQWQEWKPVFISFT